MNLSLAFGMPGLPEMVIILVIVLMLFGVGKLPKVLSQMGKGVKAFKDGMNTDGTPKEIDVTLSAESEMRSRVADAEEVDV
jgi:sec-independent protein translocase protein TatA